MAIITLTTDLGLIDSYVGSVKGVILTLSPDAVIVDLTHQIRPFDIFQAAFVLKNACWHFPGKTIHLVNVEAESQDGRPEKENPMPVNSRFLLAEHHGHYFLGRDNGIFSLVFEGLPDKIYELPATDVKRIAFPARDVLAKFACRLANGEAPHDIGRQVKNMQTLNLLQPLISGNSIRGSVIYIDHYENVIVNVVKGYFDGQRKERNFSILFKRNEHIDQLSYGYDDVPEGEKLAFFNASGYLELAINKGKAASLLGLKSGDIVQIDFQ